MRLINFLRAAGAALLLAATTAHAQSWPTKPVRFVIPFPAGGSTDIVARVIGDKLGQALGQSFIPDNRGGAGGTTGSDVAAKSPPDGYTVLICTSSTHAIAGSLYAKLPYDPVRDFAPVTLIGTATIMLVTHPSVGVHSVRELIALAKAKPELLTFASSGNGGVSHLTGEYFKAQAGIQMQHIPYKGDTPMLTDLVGGRVSLAFGTAVAFLPYVQSGKLTALAVTNAKPSPVAPGLPTVAATVPGFEALQWFGLLMPAGTPKDIVNRLNAETLKVLRLPEVRDKFAGLGIEVAGDSPEQFAAFMRAETAKWGKIVKDSGARIE
ncbi:MAG TPA: tripartite tricarboxylate transporter substrate binding protein [Burkholderiales bacterium]|jgi:tripartite-type tricarboxylate transporter receptor subunit TctC